MMHNKLGCGTNQCNSNGLGRTCSWICRRIGLIAAVVGAFNPALGAGIGAVAIYLEANDISWKSEAAVYDNEKPMNGIEEALLNNWMSTRFDIYFQNLTRIVTGLDTNINKIEVANSVLKQIYAIKAYLSFVAGKPQGSLSANAVDNRATLINVLLDQLLLELNKKFVGSAYLNEISFNPSSIDLSSIDFSTSGLSNMKLSVYTLNQTGSTGVVTSDPKSNPVINPKTPLTTVNYTKTIIGVGLIALSSYYLFFNKKKSKK